MMRTMADHEIGGAVVRRTFSRNGKYLKNGDKLTGDEVRSIPAANLTALIDSHYIELFPLPTAGIFAPTPLPGDRFMVHRGGGLFDVIEGRRLNDEPLSQDAAEALVDERD